MAYLPIQILVLLHHNGGLFDVRGYLQGAKTHLKVDKLASQMQTFGVKGP